ncbi:phospholipase A and acyltransferase 3-like [Amblyraja radiata]|uniref:phospholipase A and acyltransferase 3-like n=1 Tax=Amblyraja radiata TaxID=386614 RepID=UPI001403DFAC|nr:phospholipase A and acyltransferase 3-like [Amblyraja radiata]
MSNQQSAFNAKPGDLIEIPRTLGYKHWAIYIGHGDVVHLTSDGASGDMSTRFSRSEEIAVIKREPLAEVAGNDSWKVNNRSDIIWNPLPVDKIIKKAKKKIGWKVHYNVLNSNCEHFVNSLRYGIEISFQVIKTYCFFGAMAIINPVAAVASAAVGATAILKGLPCASTSLKSTAKK